MIKQLLAMLGLLYCALAWAAVDVNQASVAELDGIKGIGPAMSSRMLDERKKGPFKDWADLMTRVKGIGKANAARLSSEGLTVGGASYRIPVPDAATSPARPATAK
ncbi:MAG: helix-hairpin-helix domain-containing protein [Gammaproteobacteria bacterium]|nr:helix-hairpin-helix domain-containing protein [Gammaproteobacteria bacterium]